MLPPEIADPGAAGPSPDDAAGNWSSSGDAGDATPLAYNCQLLGLGSPSTDTVLTADSSREYIGFFLQGVTKDVAVAPALAPAGSGIVLTNTQSWFECRYSSHGPMVRDMWNIDTTGVGGIVLVITVSPSGQ
jgi:hypothetical protein